MKAEDAGKKPSFEIGIYTLLILVRIHLQVKNQARSSD